MGNIVLLDELTINKIAAGEVIERPASVIKEMVENSIDAEATSINVDIKNGGISYIRITDNGRGIMPDDMEIAFERHATSKIRKAEDLENVRSMGFRGEALASIAAVAKVEMISRTTQMEVGNRIVVEAGKVLEKTETACTVGTTITVSNLFFNTPVRYKFLKKDFTESGYIEDAIARLALINPNISFKLVNSGKVIIQTSGNGKIEDVVYNIYGKNVAENLLKVDYSYEDMRISGVIGKPEIARSNRSNQLFFVNGRYVKDKTLTSAIEKGYKGMLTIGKYAFAILNIEMNPSKVDVNVHPAKLEVRFEEESKVFKAVYHAANDTLLKNDLIKNSEKIEREDQLDIAKIDKKEVDDVTLFRQSYEKMNLNSVNGNAIEQIYQLKKEEKKPLEEEMKTVKVGEKQKNEIPQGNHSTMESLLELQKKMREDLEKRKQELEEEQELQENTDTKEKQVKMNLNQKIEKIEEQAENLITENNIEVQEEMKKTEETKVEAEELKEMIHKLDETEEGTISKDFNEMYLKIFGKLPQKEQIEEDEKEAENFKLLDGENLTVFDEKEEYKFKPKYKFIGIAFSTYIILEMEQELYIMDQHAAHERIMYERVKRNFYDEKDKDSQLMILPDIITLTHKEMGIAKDNIGLFEKAGFMMEEFGDNTIKISGTPSICLDLDTKELFLETLDEINTVARTAKQEIEEKFIATIACKAAVKANMALNKEEVEALMDELLKLPNPFTCPHGRPTVIKMSKYDIERKFARK